MLRQEDRRIPSPWLIQTQVTGGLDGLERSLSYRDIRFYRSIAQNQFDKELEYQRQQQRKIAEEQKSQQSGTWLGWMWGSTPASQETFQTFQEELSDDQRRELYAAVDYDERAVLAESFETSREYQKACIAVSLKRGLFALQNHGSGTPNGIISMSFDAFGASFIQRTDNLEGEISLGNLSVFNDSPVADCYRQILRVQEVDEAIEKNSSQPKFFFLKFEQNPLDERADSAITMRLRHTEIIYHKTTVESVHRFFKPPGTQPELVDVFYVSGLCPPCP